MKHKIWLRVSASVLLSAGLLGATACASSTPNDMIDNPAMAPLTMSESELKDATVKLVVGQTLNISTESLEVESFDADIADTNVAEFKAGISDGAAIFNPGIIALAQGSTAVKLVNELNEAQTFEFTVNVVAE